MYVKTHISHRKPYSIITVWDGIFSFHCVSLYEFILPAGRHASMLFQCANMYDRTGHPNTKYNIKYNCFGLVSLTDPLCRFVKVNHDLTTQLSISITDLLTTDFA